MADSAGLFLDLDGTLADSLPVLRRIYDRFLENLGEQGSDEEFESLNGVKLSSALPGLRDWASLGMDPAIVAERYLTLLRKSYNGVGPLPGARELIAAARAASMPVAVVTSAQADSARRWLRGVGLADSVDAVVGGDSVPTGKPAPDSYLEALRRTGCAAASSMAVEDSRAGACSAVAAGLETFVVGASPDDGETWPAVRGFVRRLDQLIAELPPV